MPSSVIAAMMYHPASEKLQVVFRSTGETYQYHDVPWDEWLRFRYAPSKGTYLNQQFKERGFGFDHFRRGQAPRMPAGSLRWTGTEESDAQGSAYTDRRWEALESTTT